MKSLVVVISIHHDNTVKIGNAIANVLGADLKKPKDVNPDEINDYDLVGFGSGIYSATVHKELFSIVDIFSKVKDKKAFIFSTAGITSTKKPLMMIKN